MVCIVTDPHAQDPAITKGVGRFLCTTALEETWPDNEPVLFLGEWCRIHARREHWSRRDAQVLPYHWNDRAKLHADYLYLVEFHERLLRDLAAELNRIHDTDHGLRYWRILVGPWLGYFTQMLFDRWASIHDALRYEISGTIVLRGSEADLVPNGMIEFGRLFESDDWNHHLYATILLQEAHVPCRIQERVPREAVTVAPTVTSWKRRLKLFLANSYARAASSLTRDSDAFLLATYMPVAEEMRMHRRLGQVPQFWSSVAPLPAQYHCDRRQWVVPGETRSRFEAFARAAIPWQIPRLYLEGYRELVGQTEDLPWPGNPRVIWTSNSHLFDDVFKAWAAGKTERGVPLVIGQHGGHFGTGLWCFTEDHDLRIGDRYLSWGWSEPGKSHIAPIGQLKARRPLGVRHAAQNGALLVTNDLPRYSYSMYSASVAPQWLDYFNDLCAFVERLPQRIRDALTVRLTAVDYGWNQALRWRERFPGLPLDVGQSNIIDLIRRTRLYISTYNATTYLESISMEVPTVMFWNPKHWELRDSAAPEFEALKYVGIFHDTPESAASHVAAVWDDVDAWWSSPAVVSARTRFKQRYCEVPDDLSERVATALREVIAESRHAPSR